MFSGKWIQQFINTINKIICFTLVTIAGRTSIYDTKGTLGEFIKEKSDAAMNILNFPETFSTTCAGRQITGSFFRAEILTFSMTF